MPETLTIDTHLGVLSVEKQETPGFTGFHVLIDGERIAAVNYIAVQHEEYLRAQVWHRSPDFKTAQCGHEPEESLVITTCRECAVAAAREEGQAANDAPDAEKMTVEEICEALKAAGVEDIDLDLTVHDIASEEAADVDNCGMTKQVRYIVQHGCAHLLNGLLNPRPQDPVSEEETPC